MLNIFIDGLVSVEISKHPNFIDLTGHIYTRWNVISYAGKIGRIHYWNCVCECTKDTTPILKILTSGTLRSFQSKSCGCLRDEICKIKQSTHGLAYTPEYSMWNSIKGRCTNPKDKAYENYGGRGIKMCDRWLNNVELFLEDIGIKPGPDYTLDRIDNDGDYCPENCRWATKKEQANNRRNNHVLEFDGLKLTVSEWADRLNIPYYIINNRLQTDWSIEDILTKPIIKGVYKNV